MQTSSVEELKGQISAGEYTVDSGELAGEIVAKFALIRRVRRQMVSEDANAASHEGRTLRGARSDALKNPAR